MSWKWLQTLVHFPPINLGSPPASTTPTLGYGNSYFLPLSPPPDLQSPFSFYHFFKSTSYSTYSLFEETVLCPLALVHPTAIGLACLLCYYPSIFSFPFFLFYTLKFLPLPLLFIFLYVPPPCTWW